MDEVLKIKCPKCGAILSVKNVPGIEDKNITCPVCKVRSAFSEYKTYQVKPVDSDATRYDAADETRYCDETQLTPSMPRTSDAGRLVDTITGANYPLALGMNTIGRRATSSEATVQILTADRHMSRNHAIIEVRQFPDGEVVHYLSTSANKNPTFVNGNQLAASDRIVLQSGDQIIFGSVKMRFECNS